MTPLAIKALVVLAILVLAASLGGWAVHGYYAPRLAAEQAKVGQLARDVTAQNDALEALREAADKRKAEVDRAMAQAQQERHDADVKAQQILARQRPSGVSECQAVADLLREGLSE